MGWMLSDTFIKFILFYTLIIIKSDLILHDISTLDPEFSLFEV